MTQNQSVDLSKTATIRPVKMNLRGEQIHIFPPKDAEEAKTRGVFVAGNGVTYMHLNGSVVSDAAGERGQRVLVVCYEDLADKLAEHVIAAARDKTGKARKLTVIADANVEVIPSTSGTGEFMGNRVEAKIYGYEYDGNYYTTAGKQLVVRPVPVRAVSLKTSKVDFF